MMHHQPPTQKIRPSYEPTPPAVNAVPPSYDMSWKMKVHNEFESSRFKCAYPNCSKASISMSISTIYEHIAYHVMDDNNGDTALFNFQCRNCNALFLTRQFAVAHATTEAHQIQEDLKDLNDLALREEVSKSGIILQKYLMNYLRPSLLHAQASQAEPFSPTVIPSYERKQNASGEENVHPLQTPGYRHVSALNTPSYSTNTRATAASEPICSTQLYTYAPSTPKYMSSSDIPHNGCGNGDFLQMNGFSEQQTVSVQSQNVANPVQNYNEVSTPHTSRMHSFVNNISTVDNNDECMIIGTKNLNVKIDTSGKPHPVANKKKLLQTPLADSNKRAVVHASGVKINPRFVRQSTILMPETPKPPSGKKGRPPGSKNISRRGNMQGQGHTDAPESQQSIAPASRRVSARRDESAISNEDEEPGQIPDSPKLPRRRTRKRSYSKSPSSE